jgi:HPt (histidine-containing phosphotransfer) domain-containing protein
MRTIFVLVGAAILVFLVFTAFSVQKSVQGSARLAGIKDLYFPVLERVDANTVRVDKLEELFINVVVLGDRDMLDSARELSSAADVAFGEIATLYPERRAEVAQLRAELQQYHDLAQKVSVLYLEQVESPEEDAALMNNALEAVRSRLKVFRESSYENFVQTLEATQRTTRLGLMLGIALGVMNLCFMGVLVYFIRNNIRMMSVIAEQNATLELRVAERTAQLTQKTNDINAMLQNMALGVCTVVPGNRIHPEYSAQLPEIFGVQGEIAGREIVECLFADSSLGVDVLDQVTVAIGAIVGESAMMFEFNSHLLPREMQIKAGDGSKRVLQMEWSPIVSDDTVEKLLFIAQDVTHLRELELASEQQKAELEVISRLLALPSGKFNDFIDTSRRFNASNRELIAAAPAREEQTIAALFRNMHTIKGNARTLGLTLVTDVAHEAEQTYDRLRKDAGEAWDVGRMLAELDGVDAAIDRYVDVNDNKLGRKGRAQELLTGRGAFLPNDELERLKQLATVIGRSRQDSGIVELCERVGRLGLVPLERIVSGCVDSVASLARDLGKPEPAVVVTGGEIAFNPPFAEALKSSLMHMVRNALDHGIEAPEERVAAGKASRGELRIACVRSGETVELSVSDDGRGLAMRALLSKGRAAGVFGPEERPAREVVAELIFRSGLSTAQAVTQMSGRGVGMDAVRTFLGEQGATTAIELTEPANDRDFTPFRFVIRVPAVIAGV